MEIIVIKSNEIKKMKKEKREVKISTRETNKDKEVKEKSKVKEKIEDVNMGRGIH